MTALLWCDKMYKNISKKLLHLTIEFFDNIRALHSTLTRCGRDCRLEWNAGGHFKDADLRTARAFAWVMEGKQ